MNDYFPINIKKLTFNNYLEFYKNKRPIKTASDTQVRNKIYNSSVNKWKKYERFLKKYYVKLKT